MDATSSGSLIAGIALGVPVGYVLCAARRAWFDYRDTRAKVPVLRRAAWRLSASATVRVTAVAVLVIAVVWVSAHG